MLIRLKFSSSIWWLIIFLFEFCQNDETKKDFQLNFSQLFPDLFTISTESTPTTIYNIFDPNFMLNFIENQKTNLTQKNNEIEKILLDSHRQIKGSKIFITESNTESAIRIKLNEPFFQETARLFCIIFLYFNN